VAFVSGVVRAVGAVAIGIAPVVAAGGGDRGGDQPADLPTEREAQRAKREIIAENQQLRSDVGQLRVNGRKGRKTGELANWGRSKRSQIVSVTEATRGTRESLLITESGLKEDQYGLYPAAWSADFPARWAGHRVSAYHDPGFE